MAAKTIFDGGVTSKLWLDRRNFYPDPQKVSELYTDLNPFTTVLSKLPVKNVDDPVYKLFEHESRFVKQEFTVSTALTIASSGAESNALTIGTITGLPATITTGWEGLVCEIWDSTKATKRGVVFVSDCASTTTFKAKTLKATAITTVSGDYFIVIGRIRGEGSVAPEAIDDEVSTVWNSVAYLSDTCEVTGALYKASKLKGYSNEFARLREEMFKGYKNFTEQTLLKQTNTLGTNFNGSDTFAETSLRTISDPGGTSGSVRTTYGYIPILEDYGVTYSGSGVINDDTNIFKTALPSYPDFVKYTEVIFDKRDEGEALAFVGRGAITTIAQQVANEDKKYGWKGKVQLGDTKWNTLGFAMRALETPHGIIHLVPTKSLRNAYKNYMVIPNLNNIGIAQFSPDEYKNDIKKDNGYDGVKDSIESMKGLYMTLLKSHHMMVLQ